jgi:anti-anti-sigma factor
MSARPDQPGLRVRHVGGSSYVLDGELDMATAPALEASFAPVTGPIRLHLGALTFLDSAGIAALVRLHKRCEADGCSLRLDGCSPQAERVLRIVDLYDALTVAVESPFPDTVGAPPTLSRTSGPAPTAPSDQEGEIASAT